MNQKFDYFHANETEQYLFLQLPLMLIKDEKFKNLSSDSKILYSLLLNRTSLSVKNGWLDENNNVYIVYTIKEIAEDLNCWEQKAQKSMKELKDIGLVKTVRQGLTKPNLIFVMNFATELKYQTTEIKKEIKTPEPSIKPLNDDFHHSRSSENHHSGNPQITIQKILKSPSSNTNTNKNNFMDIDNSQSQVKSTFPNKIREKKLENNDNDNDNIIPNSDFSEKETEPSSTTADNKPTEIKYTYDHAKQLIYKNIEYDFYKQHRNTDIDLIDELVDCMLDVILTNQNTVKLNGEDKDRQMVINQYLKLNTTDIDLILQKYKEQSHKITHIHSYLKTILYNVKQEQGHYYTNAVRVDNPYLF